MRIAVTGGGGFIGKALCRRLIADGHTLICLRRAPGLFVEGAEVLVGTLQESDAISALVKDADVCVHLASSSGPANSNGDVLADLELNLRGGVALFQKCVEASVKRVIFTSSGGTIYGAPDLLPTPETALLRPTTAYSAVKASLEGYLAVYKYQFGLQHRILRLANPFGPSQAAAKAQGVIPIFIDRIRNGEPIEIWGDGSIVRDFIFIDDVVEAISTCLDDSGDYETYNIGSGIGRTLNEVISAIEKVSGISSNVIYKSSRKSDVPINILDCSLAHAQLGWSAKVNFDQGIEKTWRERCRTR